MCYLISTSYLQGIQTKWFGHVRKLWNIPCNSLETQADTSGFLITGLFLFESTVKTTQTNSINDKYSIVLDTQ